MSKPLHGVRRLALSAAMRLLGACDAAQSAWQCAKKDVHMARADFVENKIRKELLSAPAIGFASAQKMIAKSNNGSWGEAGWAGASQACSRFMAAAGPEQLRDLSVEIAAGGAEAKIFFCARGGQDHSRKHRVFAHKSGGTGSHHDDCHGGLGRARFF